MVAGDGPLQMSVCTSEQKLAVWPLARVCWATGLLSLAMAGCSPTYNWRQARPEGAAVAALLPCKPDAAQRTVPMAGQQAALAMLSCDVGDLTFALAALRLPTGMVPAEAALGWQQASAASLKADPAKLQAWPAQVARLPPGVVVQGWQVQGQRHTGQTVQARALQVLRPSEVVQLVVYGNAPADVLQTLWEGVQVDAAP
jgi:hypothetical protein